MARKQNGNSLFKVIMTDLAGVGCLLLVPVLGPLPGPGGIPLLIAGFGLLAANHDWADDAVTYVRKNSDHLRSIVFPDRTWPKRGWDAFALLLFIIGFWLNLTATWWVLKGLSYGVMAGSTTVFMMNRNRLEWLDKKLKQVGKR